MSNIEKIQKAIKSCKEEINFYKDELKDSRFNEHLSPEEDYCKGRSETYCKMHSQIKIFEFIISALLEKQERENASETNRFITTIRENVKYPNKDGEYGKWDILNQEQRKFLIECADYMEVIETELNKFVKGKQKREQEWIPVSERLPEYDGSYYCTVKVKDGIKDLQSGAITGMECVYVSNKWKNVWFQEILHIFDVIAWQPLPEPYKEVQNE